MATYRTAAQEWAEEYRRLHKRPGLRRAMISPQGARILRMLGPYPWEPGSQGYRAPGQPYFQGVGNRVEIQWDQHDDEFVVGHAHGAPHTGFPRGDANAILRAFRGGHERRRWGGLLRPRSRRSRRAGR